MPDIDSIGFDLHGCALREQSKGHRAWVSDQRVAHLLRFEEGPPNWPFDLSDPDAAAYFYFNQSTDMKGAMLSMDVLHACGGEVEVLRGLFKYRAPVPKSLAMAYVGILWIPFETCRFQINVEAMEMGETGLREAMAMAVEPEGWPQQEGPVPIIENEEQLAAMYEKASQEPAQEFPSDDVKWDVGFPDHPLTKVRLRLTKIANSLKLDQGARALKPFRIK
jgi:hypothetical protein